MGLVRTCLEPFLDLLYPPRCLLCGRLGPDYLCSFCLDGILTPLPEPICARCGHPRPIEACFRCEALSPAFVRARACGLYDDDLREAIHLFKFRNRPMLANSLGHLMSDYARGHSKELGDLRFDAIIPIPMYRARERVRGYNQSTRLATVVGSDLGIPVHNRLLSRDRPTPPQVGLNLDDRLKNLAHAFTAKAELATGKRFLLIDDVSTTGSTFREAAAALKAAGARAVYCLALAGE